MIKYIKNYPRPQFVRDEWENLNGEWNFIFDDENMGEQNLYFVKFPNQNKINVPFTYETELSGIHDSSIHHYVWYNRKINITDTKTLAKKILLHFEGSDYFTKVWINGNYIGENEGGYTRFSFEISKYLVSGVNDITVKVEDSLSKSQPRGKQRYKKESFKCWYIETTGIWKTVWLEFVDNYYISYVKNTPLYDHNQIKLEVDAMISESDYSKNHFDFEAVVSFKDHFVVSKKVKLIENNQELKINIGDENNHVEYWDLENPNLYEIEYRLYRNDELVDCVYSYFGLREISIVGNKIYLNNKELYQKLILDQGYWKESHLTPPSEEAIIQDIDYVQSFGFNGVRKHQKIEDERFLYWCDVKGVLVWCEMPSFYEYNDYSIERFTIQWIKAVKQNYNHPCIITWVPFNESWGVSEVKSDIKEQSFVNSIYYLTKAMDNTRIVITNDGWEHTISDVITIHDYKQDSKELENLYITNKDKILIDNEPFKIEHSVFAQNYQYKGQPVIMSEYGGIALTSDKGWGYGTQAQNEVEFGHRFEELTNALKKATYLSGYCYTQLSDVQQEINGLVCEDRSIKFNDNVNEKIKEINKS